MVNCIKDHLENKYGGAWLVVLRILGRGREIFSYVDGCYINFMMGEFDVSIAKIRK